MPGNPYFQKPLPSEAAPRLRVYGSRYLPFGNSFAERKSLRAYKEGIAAQRAASPPQWLPHTLFQESSTHASY
jgi:hypothetical protein